MLIDIRLSELQSNTSNSIPLTLIIGFFFCYYLFHFLPYNIAISQGGINPLEALNIKLYNWLIEKVTVAKESIKLFVQSKLNRKSSSSETKLYDSEENLFSIIYLRDSKPSSNLEFSTSTANKAASPKNNNVATASGKG